MHHEYMHFDSPFEFLSHALEHAFFDTLHLVPFLFITYLAMEILEHHASEKSEEAVQRAGAAGPAFGAFLGIIPQCGFSTVAATLYSARVVTLGTLIAVFLSTSDEMLPILIAEQASVGIIAKVLVIKVIVAMAAGFIIDFVLRKLHRDGDHHVHIHELCEQEHCDCEDGAFKSALKHTVHVSLFIFAISLALEVAIGVVGEESLANFMAGNPGLSVVAAALVGLIPNCAASVAITELYLQGALGAGAMVSGLLVGAGVGLLVLFRTNKPLKNNLAIAALLLAIGVGVGLVLTFLGVTL